MTAKLEITPEISAALDVLSNAVKASYTAQGGEVDIVHMGVAFLPVKDKHINTSLSMSTLVTCGADSDVLILCGQLFAESAMRLMLDPQQGEQNAH